MFDAFPASATGLDRSFDVDLFAGWRVVQLHNFCVYRCAAAVGQDQAIETKPQAGVSLDPPGHIDLSHMAVHARVPIVSFIDGSCAERSPNLRVGARKGVL